MSISSGLVRFGIKRSDIAELEDTLSLMRDVLLSCEEEDAALRDQILNLINEGEISVPDNREPGRTYTLNNKGGFLMYMTCSYLKRCCPPEDVINEMLMIWSGSLVLCGQIYTISMCCSIWENHPDNA